MSEIENYILKTKAAKHWENIGCKPHHGIAFPLFSLRCEKSYGIGEYLDLLQVIDWCNEIGFDIIQLLPLNELSIDFSPYNAISSCALNPLHISLHALAKNNPKLEEKLQPLKIFNTYQRVNYPQLNRLKMDFLQEYYFSIFEDLKNDKDFELFIKNNPWLDEYSVFKCLQKAQDYKKWYLWPKELQNINKNNISKYKEKYQDEIHFYQFIQYLCFKQLEEVKKHATKKNVFLLGDVPILLSKNSCDIWFNKDIFDFDYTAGVPPDDFNKHGQNWNFPLFNWKKLKKTNYHWWKRRLNTISNLYHMYRIDHVVGFFRTWAILPDEDPLEGRFLPQDPIAWKDNGKERLLMMLNSSPLFPIAEDLGTIPRFVYDTLKELGICGTRVMFWQKKLSKYINLNNYEPLTLTTMSTHDTYTFQGWWEKHPQESIKFAQFKNWNYEYLLSYQQKKELLKDSHNTSSIFHINLFQEYLALYPDLVWPKIEDERINISGVISTFNWTYRFKPFFEEIIKHKKLQKDLKEIIS